MNVGLVSYGLYLPESYETAEQISERSGLSVEQVKKLGVERKCFPGKDDQPVVMASKAARKALGEAEKIKPEDVDLVIWTGEEYKDYVAQTASIRLQEEVGCVNAWAFDLVGQNVTLILGLRVAHDLIMGDDSIRTVLLAGGTRNVDLVDYSNPDTYFLLPLSASGGAILLRREHDRNRLISTAFTVDTDMADEVFVPGGGTEIPFRKDNLDAPIMFYRTPRPGVVREYLEGRWTEALVETGRKALSGQTPDYVALRHLSLSDRRKVLAALGTTPERSLKLDEWGCHGTNDVVLSLDMGRRKEIVRKGSHVLLLTGGIGFTYAAALIHWGKG
jgi:3-oxoacyl-[acyl-carrier-protein] synthase-3